MTPLLALVVAVVAGMLARRQRDVPLAVVPPMLAVVAAQSWYLGSGRGSNSPAQTTGDGGYWIIQLAVVLLACAAASLVCARRARRGQLPGRVRHAGGLLGAGVVAAFSGTLGLFFVVDRPAKAGAGSGSFPLTGVVGLVVGVLAVAWMVAVSVRGRAAARG